MSDQLDVSSLLLVQNLPSEKNEDEVRRHFSALCGPVLWSSRLGSGDAVVLRLTDEVAVVRAVSVANNSSWCGKVLQVDPCNRLIGDATSELKAIPVSSEPKDFTLGSAHEKPREESARDKEASNQKTGTDGCALPVPMADQLPSVATTAQLDSERMAMLQNIANLSFSPHTPSSSPWASQTAILPVKNALGLEEDALCAYPGTVEDSHEYVDSVMKPLSSVSPENNQESGQQASAQFNAVLNCLSAQSSQDALRRIDQTGLNNLLGQDLNNMPDEQRLLLATYISQQMQQGQHQHQQQQQQQMYLQQLLGGGNSVGSGRPLKPTQVNSTPLNFNQTDLLRSLVTGDVGNSSSSNRPSSSSGMNNAATAAAALLQLAGGSCDGGLNPDSQNSLNAWMAMNQTQKPALIRTSTGKRGGSLSARASLDHTGSLPSSATHRGRNFDPFSSNQRHQQKLGHKIRETSPSGSSDWGNLFPSGNFSAGQPLGGGVGMHTQSNSTGSAQQILSLHVLQEFSHARSMLVQLMGSAYKFLHSESIKEFYERLNPIAALYDEMHELCVVEKRSKCREMAALRQELVKELTFNQVLNAVCSLRYHLHSLSRKMLVLNQSPDNIPIDLLLGSAGPEVYRLVKSALTADVAEFFSNELPNTHLAVLVFAEFTTVDPSPPKK